MTRSSSHPYAALASVVAGAWLLLAYDRWQDENPDRFARAQQITDVAAVERVERAAVPVALPAGLLPLHDGPDPESGLWEFALEGSGRVPSQHAVCTEDTPAADDAVVLVLTPGQGPEESRFVAKHPVTRAQWLMLQGEDPSVAGFATDMTTPEVDATPGEVATVLARWGLLPVEQLGGGFRVMRLAGR